MTQRAGSGWNPLAGAALRTRADLAEALERLLAPLEACRSDGAARIRISAAGAAFDRAAIELEGFARPLWGAIPAAVGGMDLIDWAVVRRGLVNGTDPAHPEFWGWPGQQDQRLVEAAVLGFALLAVPGHIWTPLDPQAQDRVARWLRHCTEQTFSANNWQFFRLLILEGLRHVGIDLPLTTGGDSRARIEALYLGKGWYRDGPGRRVDHYTGFAFHPYALLLHRFGKGPENDAPLDRARAFAPAFAGWFDSSGRGLAYGRSMTYRFAMAAFFGAYALAERGDPVLPWGVLKGLVLRHLRWWSEQPIADRDGILSIGHAYPNSQMAENYNAPASPYWAAKAFLPLALPADHPFWTAEELPLPADLPQVQPAPGFVLHPLPDQVVALAAGQEARIFRHGAEKYAKFAYSTRFPFSVEARDAVLATAALDGALGLEAEGRGWRTRHGCKTARVAPGVVHCLWRPWPDIGVETWLMPWRGGHLRRHRIVSPVALDTVEGGFALARRDGLADRHAVTACAAHVAGGRAASVIVDLAGGRAPRIHGPDPNVNLADPRTWVPQLTGRIGPGETVLACWCAAGDAPARPDPGAARAHMAAMLARPHGWQTVGAMSGAPDI